MQINEAECEYGQQTCGTTCTTAYEGGKEWDKMHDVCEEIPCSICSEHCHSHLKAWRDKIAMDKGKKVYDKANLKRECENWRCTGSKL